MKSEIKCMEDYFSRVAENIIGKGQCIMTPFGKQPLLYADWTATGRAYQPIEDWLLRELLPFIGNTHTTGSHTGELTSCGYAEAKQIIKQHVGAGANDALIFSGSGMTHAVNKLQRILGLRVPEQKAGKIQTESKITTADNIDQPVIFVSHMEHHSNHTSWLETIADVVIIPPAGDGNVDLNKFSELLTHYKQRPFKIAAITACSNVTGIETPYHNIASMIHGVGGYCFVDFACSAPYVPIDMHPADASASLDAIYFSGHKFLGGPGTPGALIFNKRLYNNRVPDQPGGGTILYSNPWNVHEYIADIEQREDGGTPPFYGAIKLALCIRLKETMGTEQIRKREEEIMSVVFKRLENMPGLSVLEPNYKKRLGIISFTVPGIHHDLFVKILNDRFGVQARSGCSCAGTYGHYLLKVNRKKSYHILHALLRGEPLYKPGWIRLSIHPTMSDASIDAIMNAVEQIILNTKDWCKDYAYNVAAKKFVFRNSSTSKTSLDFADRLNVESIAISL